MLKKLLLEWLFALSLFVPAYAEIKKEYKKPKIEYYVATEKKYIYGDISSPAAAYITFNYALLKEDNVMFKKCIPKELFENNFFRQFTITAKKIKKEISDSSIVLWLDDRFEKFKADQNWLLKKKIEIYPLTSKLAMIYVAGDKPEHGGYFYCLKENDGWKFHFLSEPLISVKVEEDKFNLNTIADYLNKYKEKRGSYPMSLEEEFFHFLPSSLKELYFYDKKRVPKYFSDGRNFILDKKTKKELQELRSALNVYFAVNDGTYPRTLKELVPHYYKSKINESEWDYDPNTGEIKLKKR